MDNEQPKLRQQVELEALVHRYGGDHSRALVMMGKLIAARKEKRAMSQADHRSVVFETLVDRYGNGSHAFSALEKINASRATRGVAPLDNPGDVRAMAAEKPVVYKTGAPLRQQPPTAMTAAQAEQAAEQRYAALSDREQRTICSMRSGPGRLRSLSKTFEIYDQARERVLSGRYARQLGGE